MASHNRWLGSSIGDSRGGTMVALDRHRRGITQVAAAYERRVVLLIVTPRRWSPSLLSPLQPRQAARLLYLAAVLSRRPGVKMHIHSRLRSPPTRAYD